MTRASTPLTDASRPIHFVGVAGTGMSALAQFRAMGGKKTSGSDRLFDAGAGQLERQQLEALGVRIVPQDGSGIPGAAAVVTSTAVETEIPDLVRAHKEKVPVMHRADVLAVHLSEGPGVAIAGTSGKSTVTAMVFEILERAGADPSVIAGGDLVVLGDRGLRGNAWRGSGPLVAEADESDGTLVRHAPLIGTILNLHRDHMDETRVFDQFSTFASKVRGTLVVADAPGLTTLHPSAHAFGFGDGPGLRAHGFEPVGFGSRFRIGTTQVELPLPGLHNAWNALAAIATTQALDIPLEKAARALQTYRGVGRRFELVGTANGIRVVDDYAHNPSKIAAALTAAQQIAPRVLAWFQPHGFSPSRFMREELRDIIPPLLRSTDRLWVSSIHYAGGTAVQDISGRDLADDLRTHGAPAGYAPDRSTWPTEIARKARPGDLILLMGARDPSLGAFARTVFTAIQNA